MNRNLTIECSRNTTKVLIKNGLLCEAGKHILQKKAFIITDDNVEKLYLLDLVQSLEKHDIAHTSFSIGVGESAKTLETVEKIYAFLLENKINRSDCIISLGGGVVGDIAGFAAATYMRGITLIHIPTTIIAQADSSIGGKCGVNYKGIKNLVGAFYQPKLVLTDTGVLKTLSKRDFNAGMAEVIKYAALFDYQMFCELESAPYNIEEIIYRCCKIKARMVEIDEFDNTIRKMLNFGHTFGHSIETASNNTLFHGEAVAIGMVIATRLGERLKITKEGTTDRLKTLLERFSLPTSTDFDIMYSVVCDKKAQGDHIEFIFISEFGRAKYLNLQFSIIIKALDDIWT